MNHRKSGCGGTSCNWLWEDDLARWRTDQFEEIVTNLRYEGKSSQGKNVKEMAAFLQCLDTRIFEHANMEEAVVFPFVKTHLPRLQATVELFCDQHQELQHRFKELKFLFRQLLKQKGKSVAFGKTAGKIHGVGIYAACYLRHHLYTENEKILKIVKRELRKDEKRELSIQVDRYLERMGHRNGLRKGVKHVEG